METTVSQEIQSQANMQVINTQDKVSTICILLDLPVEIILMIASFCGLSRFKLAATCSSLLFLFDWCKNKIPIFIDNKKDWILISEGTYDELSRNTLDMSGWKQKLLLSDPNFDNVDYAKYVMQKSSNCDRKMLLEHPNSRKFVIDYFRARYNKETRLLEQSRIPTNLYNFCSNLFDSIICDYFDDFKKSYERTDRKLIQEAKYELIRCAIDYRAENCLLFLIQEFHETFSMNSILAVNCIIKSSEKVCVKLLELSSKNWNYEITMNYIKLRKLAMNDFPADKFAKFGYII